MTPADKLRAAATLLRDHLASAATDGPWHAVQYDAPDDFEAGLGTTPDEPDIAGHGYEGGGFVRLCDAQYAAAMHPGVGTALAELFDAAADLATAYPVLAHDHYRPACDDYTCDLMCRVAAAARAVLGAGPTNGDTR
ncbi:hypothetical protein LG634_24765 [Streptomyces bambusae]|uniref:hypothetical protein n=1 Tax=Streptomyces bambusae TaxID=1550616 RepID=UPI001CFCCB63|nr:hypothetical protein [Streptomyces bambusae]MCB5168026.1 hypothetical protein [Streptomyces bambusae]